MHFFYHNAVNIKLENIFYSQRSTWLIQVSLFLIKLQYQRLHHSSNHARTFMKITNKFHNLFFPNIDKNITSIRDTKTSTNKSTLIFLFFFFLDNQSRQIMKGEYYRWNIEKSKKRKNDNKYYLSNNYKFRD